MASKISASLITKPGSQSLRLTSEVLLQLPAGLKVMSTGWQVGLMSAQTAYYLPVKSLEMEKCSLVRKIITKLVEDIFIFSFIAGPELQKPLAHQCAIMLSEAESFIAGGIIDMDSGTVTRAASFYHWDIAIHTMLPDMPTPRHGHSCSLLNIEDSDKPVIVVLGGLGEQKEFLNSVDVFSVELKVWATLKEPAPSYFVNSALVAAERNNLLYVIGGFGAGENGQPERHSQVYCFDGDTGMWAQLNNSVPVTNDINDLSQRTFAMKLPEKFCPI